MLNSIMNVLDSYPDTVFAFGPAALQELLGYLLKEDVESVLVFSGGSSASGNRSAIALQMAFGKTRVKMDNYSGIPAEPVVEDVRKMVQAIEQYHPQEIIAVGGGSVMDAAKAAYLSWQTGWDVQKLFGVNQATAAFPDKKFKRVICVPTTSGTGSEATPYSNIVDPEVGVKKLIMDPAIIPAFSFIDPQLTLTMPPALTSTTALDALVHCVESVLNFKAQNAHPDSVKWGVKGIRLIAKGLPEVLRDPQNLQARAKLSAAAVLGGMCIRNRPTSLPHLCSFSFYGKVPHGVAVAALLPPFWKYYLDEPAVCAQTMLLAGIFGKDIEKKPEKVVANAAAFIAANGGPAKLSDLGCPESIIEKAAADAVLNPVKLQSCPRPISPETAAGIISEILKKAW